MYNGDFSMRMIKEVVMLSLLAVVSLCVLNIAAASSIANPYSVDPSIHLTVDSYPKQVNVGQNFDIHGFLKRGDMGMGNVEIHHVGDRGVTLWTITTNADGSFTDTFHFSEEGSHYVSYCYIVGYDVYISDGLFINAIPK